MRLAEPLEVGGVVIEEVDYDSVTDDQIRRLSEFVNHLSSESNPEDPPVPCELTETEVRQQMGFVVRRGFWGYDPGGDQVASARVSWTTTEDNRHVVQAGIHVRADRRRQGVGTALLRLLVSVAEAEGRTLVVGHTSDRVPAGEAFARLVGAEIALEQHINRVVLADVDRALVERWIAEGPERAPGYRLVAVDGVYPDDLVERIVDVIDVMNTAPRGDLDMEDQPWTVDQAREVERMMLASGTERWSLFAMHDDSGDLVGFTEVGWNAKAPQTVWQWGTAVRPEHRGHAIGKWLKATMLRRILDERPSEDLRTGNADSNEPMLGINNQLGFRPYQSDVAWQAKVEALRVYLDGSSV